MQLLKLLLYFSVIFTTYSCQTKQDKGNLSILPTPTKLESEGGYSKIDKLQFPDDEKLSVYRSWLETWKSTIVSQNKNANVTLHIDQSLKEGAYTLNIGEDLVNISYSELEGLKNSLSSLLQLLSLKNNKLPICYIFDDRPFSYRGMHLDVARHIFTVQEVKQYIEYLAFYKMNYFHWHLTDDQGWRIEIKKYPRLQEVAAYRSETLIGHYNDQPHRFDSKKYGGYYTQEEIKEVVSYAMARGIDVIPEIDVPGHSLALLSAYPYLGCQEKTYKAGTKWGIFDDILCPKEETFDFLNHVFDEIIELFPSQYIHIGGDECPKSVWKNSQFCQELMKTNGLKDEMELQSYFIQRLEKHINSRGKSIIGWDEILEGGLAPNATVMSRRGKEGAIQAANENHPVIMSPTSHCYFDYYQSDDPSEPLAIGGYLPIAKVYNWQVIPEALFEEKHKYILGGQGNVWTEYMPTFKQVEYMSLARMATLSEVLWGRKSENIIHFANRLLQHTAYWKSQSKNMAKHILIPTLTATANKKDGVTLLVNNLMDNTTNYIKTPKATEYFVMDTTTFPMRKAGHYSIQSEYNGFKSKVKNIDYTPHMGNHSNIIWKENASEKYAGSGPSSIINGVLGSDEKYGGTEWLGFNGKNADMTLIFDKKIKISSITTKTFRGEGQWIYLPKKISVFKVDESGNETLLREEIDLSTEGKILRSTLNFDTISTNKIRVLFENHGLIPEGKQGAGHKSWLFIDEVIVK